MFQLLYFPLPHFQRPHVESESAARAVASNKADRTGGDACTAACVVYSTGTYTKHIPVGRPFSLPVRLFLFPIRLQLLTELCLAEFWVTDATSVTHSATSEADSVDLV